MRNFLTIVILTICSLTIFAQDKITEELKTLTANNQYDKIIEQYAPASKDYSARSLYLIGQAYYMKENDEKCLIFMNLSIEKNSKDPAPYYIKASTLYYMKNYEDAILCFKEAIQLKPDDAEFYSGLGDSYLQLKKNDLALEAYKKATEMKNCSYRPYSMIGQIYMNLAQNDKALEAYYNAKSRIKDKSDSYINILFNIGLVESLQENYDKAEPNFIEITKLDSTDYHTYAKLIQIYYHRGEYEKAKPYKAKLYAAHKNGLLKDYLADMFCFDQFKWNGKLIQVFERYQDSSADIYEKHRFYIKDTNENIEFKIQTEYSPFSAEHGGAKYLLCMSKGNTHSTFNIGFNDDFKYDDLKKSVIDILENRVKAAATTTFGTK